MRFAKELPARIESHEHTSQAPSLELASHGASPSLNNSRYMEIDLFRGVGVCLMLLFHITFDLKTFADIDLRFPIWYWQVIPKMIGFLFFLLVGISIWIRQSKCWYWSFSYILKRFLKLCAIAASITLFTAIAKPEYTIYFGTIHCIAVSVLFSYPFLKQRRYNLQLGLLFILCGMLLRFFSFPFSWLLWLGFWPEGGAGGDYYPLLPWFGVVLLGVNVGEKLYPLSSKPYSLSSWLRKNSLTRSICFLGRHSLLVYLIHQPLIVCAVEALF